MFQSRVENGQGLVEYSLILSLVAIAVIAALTLLGPAVGEVYSEVAAKLNPPAPPPAIDDSDCTPASPLQAPGAPAAVSPSGETLPPGSLTFTWNANPCSEQVDKYQVRVRWWFLSVTNLTATCGDSTCTASTSLEERPWFPYRWKVRAHNAAGWGDYSAELSVRIED